MSGLVEVGEIYLWFSLMYWLRLGEGGGSELGFVSGNGLKNFLIGPP